MKVRDIKKRYFQRQWFSAAQPPYSYFPRRHGLAYGDVRSHQKVRRACQGQLALLTVPTDDMHLHRLKCKKQQKKDDKFFNRQVRLYHTFNIPGRENPFKWPKHMSFRDKIRFIHKQSAK